MATIGSLILEIAGDNSRLKRSLSDSKNLTNQYAQEVLSARRDFARQTAGIREDLFRGALSPAAFAQAGQAAARQYNTAVLEGIASLRTAGQLTPQLHAQLVQELHTTGIESGKALTLGMDEGSVGGTANLTRRFQSVGVSVAFAMEAMANGTESGSKRALRSIALLAFAFGPEVGGITLAITTATQFMLDYFHKAQAEAEKTMLQFRTHLAELAREGPGGFVGAAQLKTQIQSGDPFANIEGKRKEESDQQFEARRLGVVGITRAIQQLNALPAPKATTGGFIAGGSEEVRKTRDRLKELGDELVILKAQSAALEPVFQKALRAETDAAQNALDEAARKKDAKAKPNTVLEQQLSQVLQTKEAMEKLGESIATVAEVTRAPLVRIFDTANDRLAEHLQLLLKLHKGYDNTILQLEEIAAKAAEALIGMLTLAKVPAIKLTTTGVGAPTPDILRTTPLTHEQITQRETFRMNTILAGGSGFTGPLQPQVAPLPLTGPGSTGPGVNAATITAAAQAWKDALSGTGDTLTSFGDAVTLLVHPTQLITAAFLKLPDVVGGAIHGIASTLKGWAGQLASLLNPVALVGHIFEQFASSFVPVLEPLTQVFADLAAVVARDLAPVFAAFEPVLRSLIPVVDALLRVFAPILTALAPMFQAFVPILKALFPIIKEGAIIATYLFQAFAVGASIFLRAVGNIVIGFGTIIKALATAIDKLPFVSAKGAINAAQGIIDFGNALLQSATDFKDASDAMGKARDDISKVTFDDTAGAVAGLGEAAKETADALSNVPTWWRASLAVFQATNVRGGGNPIDPNAPVNLNPVGIGGPTFQVPPIGTPSGSSGGAGGPIVAGPSFNMSVDKIEITDKRDARSQLRALVAEAQRLSQATFGTTSRWAEVL